MQTKVAGALQGCPFRRRGKKQQMKLFTSIKGIARGIERNLEEGRTAKAKARSSFS